MRGLRFDNELAAPLGQELGEREVLLRCLSAQQCRAWLTRCLIIVLGDQFDLDAAAFDGFDPGQDAVWMAEVSEESTHVWSSKPRIAIFLAAMRHFAQALRDGGRPLHYTRLDAVDNGGSFGAQLQADIERLRPTMVMMPPATGRIADNQGEPSPTTCH